MQEYKRESYEMFTALLENIQHEVVRILARVQVRAEEDVEAVETQRRREAPMQYRHDEASAVSDGQGQGAVPDEPFVRQGRKVGRNEMCPCGSGKKFKHCHGRLS
jgi:preprotein translocase subunit SecA